MQEIWLTVVNRLPRFRFDPERGPLRGWVLDTAKKALNNRAFRLRSRGNGKTRTLEKDDDPASPDLLLKALNDRDLVETLLARLRKRVSPRCYDVLHLRLIEQRTVDDVAARFDLLAEQV